MRGYKLAQPSILNTGSAASTGLFIGATSLAQSLQAGSDSIAAAGWPAG